MVSLKHIYVCKEQLSLMHIMVRAAEVTMGKLDPDHFELAEKISQSRWQRSVRAVIPLTGNERKLLLQYNLSYCANLGQALFDADSGQGIRISEYDALHLYRVATQIFSLIS